jgi:hypothetical protein
VTGIGAICMGMFSTSQRLFAASDQARTSLVTADAGYCVACTAPENVDVAGSPDEANNF